MLSQFSCLEGTCRHVTNSSNFFFLAFQVSDWKEIENLAKLSELDTVYFEHNPIHKSADYRRKMKMILPQLRQIDATLCR